MRAPKMAKSYYNLPQGSSMRDVFACIRADEAHHRDANHHFGDIPADAPNTRVEHLRKGHFQVQDLYSGLEWLVRESKAKSLSETFKQLDKKGNGFIDKEELKQ